MLFELDGYEADDIIGTLAGRPGKEAGDGNSDWYSDTLQLVRDGVSVIMTRKGISDTQSMTRLKLREMEVEPEQMKDLKGLMGDTSIIYRECRGGSQNRHQAD